jgi:RimJ/RimL family protein N-acetyltransferase
VDLDLLGRLRNDPRLQATLLALPRGSSRERVREWVQRQASDEASLFYVIASLSADAAIGFIQLVRMDPVHRHAELGVALDEPHRAQGHGTRAIRLLEGHARRVFNLRKVTLRVLANNAAAIRAYERLGYRRVGTFEAHFYHDGHFHDVVAMEALLAGSEGRCDGEDGKPGSIRDERGG